MNQQLIFYISALLWICSSQTSFCVFDKYEKCSSIHCGNVPEVRYPFYIQDQQQQYCGYPGFNLSCTNKTLLLRISSRTFQVQKIFYHNCSLRVSDVGFLNIAETCTPPSSNLSHHGIGFNLNWGSERTVALYSNCEKKLPRNLKSYSVKNCSRKSSDALPILEMFSDDLNWEYAAKWCRVVVSTPVERVVDLPADAVKRGLVLSWKATNCNVCLQSGGRCGFDEVDYRFQCYCRDRAHLHSCHQSIAGNNTWLKLKIGSAIAGAIIFICFLALFLWCKNNCAHARHVLSDPASRSEVEEGSIYFGIPVFSYQELQQATDRFDPERELGDGGFGAVYHGVLKDGREVAVKRLYENNYRRVEQFMNEVEILTRMRHKNLVSLYGCTSRRSRELLLVYEYVSNGTVADHLHGDLAAHSPLTWSVRMSIAIETASALAYLHANDIIHRDVKTNNILLDSNFSVKVADFGLSRLFPTDMTHISTAPQGTPGYVDPEYHLCYQLSEKSDVYSFGVVLVELISSLQAIDICRGKHEINLANLAITKIQSCALNELMDPSLGYESDSTIYTMTSLVAELAFRCLQQDKEMRPSMEEVFQVLKEIESTGHEAKNSNTESDAIGEELMHISPLPCREVGDSLVLKNRLPPPSPISVTDKWISRSTTPNTSGFSVSC